MAEASAPRNVAEAMSLLRVPTNFNEADLRRAKRALLFQFHPDHGGKSESHNTTSVDEVLASYDFLLSVLNKNSSMDPTENLASLDVTEQKFTRDLPSFTIGALPVDAYHLLFVAAHEIGEVVEEEEPYFMVVHMSEPSDFWCEIDVVPDAGASTISLSVTQFNDASGPPVDIAMVRDLWVHTINELQQPL